MIAHVYKDRAAWLLARQAPDTITASEAAAILGVHPQSSAWYVWCRKRGLFAEDGNEATQRGNRWESAVLASYEDASGNIIVPPAQYVGRGARQGPRRRRSSKSLVILHHAKYDWLRASPDAFARDSHGVVGHVEAKTAMHASGWTPDVGIVIPRWHDGAEQLVPAHYAIQCYVQLAVSGMPWNDLCALVVTGGWPDVRWARFLRDEGTQNEIVEVLEAWREKHLVRGEEPPIDGSRACTQFLASKYVPRPARQATDDEAAKIRNLAAMKAQTKALEARIDVAKNELIAAADGSVLLLTADKKGPRGQTQVAAGKAGIDAKKLAAEFPAAHAACLKRGAPSATFREYGFAKETDGDSE